MGWGSASTHEVEEGQEVPQPELHEKLQAHVNRLAETAVRANEARWQAARRKYDEREEAEAAAVVSETDSLGEGKSFGGLALQLQADSVALLQQQQASFELELRQHAARADTILAGAAPLPLSERALPAARPSGADPVEKVRSTYLQSAKDEERAHELIAAVHDVLATYEVATLQQRTTTRQKLESATAARDEALEATATRGATERSRREQEALQREGRGVASLDDTTLVVHHLAALPAP